VHLSARPAPFASCRAGGMAVVTAIIFGGALTPMNGPLAAMPAHADVDILPSVAQQSGGLQLAGAASAPATRSQPDQQRPAEVLADMADGEAMGFDDGAEVQPGEGTAVLDVADAASGTFVKAEAAVQDRPGERTAQLLGSATADSAPGSENPAGENSSEGQAELGGGGTAVKYPVAAEVVVQDLPGERTAEVFGGDRQTAGTAPEAEVAPAQQPIERQGELAGSVVEGYAEAEVVIQDQLGERTAELMGDEPAKIAANSEQSGKEQAAEGRDELPGVNAEAFVDSETVVQDRPGERTAQLISDEADSLTSTMEKAANEQSRKVQDEFAGSVADTFVDSETVIQDQPGERTAQLLLSEPGARTARPETPLVSLLMEVAPELATGPDNDKANSE